WWAFLPPTIVLTLVSFGFLLLQASLDEVFNPRLRRGKRKQMKQAAARRAEEARPLAEQPFPADAPEPTSAGEHACAGRPARRPPPPRAGSSPAPPPAAASTEAGRRISPPSTGSPSSCATGRSSGWPGSPAAGRPRWATPWR